MLLRKLALFTSCFLLKVHASTGITRGYLVLVKVIPIATSIESIVRFSWEEGDLWKKLRSQGEKLSCSACNSRRDFTWTLNEASLSIINNDCNLLKLRQGECPVAIIRFYDAKSALRITFQHAICKVTPSPPRAYDGKIIFGQRSRGARPVVDSCGESRGEVALNFPVVVTTWEVFGDFVSPRHTKECSGWYAPNHLKLFHFPNVQIWTFRDDAWIQASFSTEPCSFLLI